MLYSKFKARLDKLVRPCLKALFKKKSGKIHSSMVEYFSGMDKAWVRFPVLQRGWDWGCGEGIEGGREMGERGRKRGWEREKEAEGILLSTSECPLMSGNPKNTCMRVLAVQRKGVL